jgi:dTDP-4-dehydrorhamnose 3,5-epimerase
MARFTIGIHLRSKFLQSLESGTVTYTIKSLKIEGAFEVKFERHEDTRGWFSRVYDSGLFAEMGVDEPRWTQQNESLTLNKGSVRGMHFQFEPFSESKYVRCTAGSIIDLLLDARESSPTYGVVDSVVLNSRGSSAVFIPRGCAHGFQSLEDDSRIHYLVSEDYAPKHESGFSILSKEILPFLPLKIAEISDRDRLLPLFEKVQYDSLH